MVRVTRAAALWGWLCLLLAPSPALSVDGVIEINQAAAEAGGVTPGDGPGLPVEILAAGSFRLTGSLQDTTGASSIVSVSAGGVTLDLNGFELIGDGITSVGISAETIDVTVRNGAVRNVAGLGIHLGSRGRVEGVTIRDARGGGVDCAADCKHRDLVISTTGSGVASSVTCGFRCDLLDSTLAFNGGAAAITAGAAARIEGNQIAGGNPKVEVGVGSIVSRNALSGVGARITAGGSSTISGNALDGGSVPITATGPAVIRGNVIRNAGGTAISVSGSATIEGNSIDGAAGGFGIACGAGSLVRGNTVRNASFFALEATSNPVGYGGNVFTGNNGGDGLSQVDASAIDLGGNVCGVPAACP